MYRPYIAAVTTRNVVPIAMTRAREPVRSTIARRIDSTHSEQGLMPSTKPMITVDTSRDLSPSDTSPNRGRSTVTGSGAAVHSIASVEHVPAPVVPKTPGAGGSPRSSIASAALMSCSIAPVQPIHTRSPMIVVGTEPASKPRCSPAVTNSSRLAASFHTS